MARALLADPFLPEKVMQNREDEIVKCLRCFTCMAERAATATRRCTVNPLIGREMEGTDIVPAAKKKKVLVAGGGPGGLYAAYTAARRGHQVILCEKESETGGILKSEQALPFKHEMYELAGTYKLLAVNSSRLRKRKKYLLQAEQKKEKVSPPGVWIMYEMYESESGGLWKKADYNSEERSCNAYDL